MAQRGKGSAGGLFGAVIRALFPVGSTATKPGRAATAGRSAQGSPTSRAQVSDQEPEITRFDDAPPPGAWRRLGDGDQNIVGEQHYRAEILAWAAGGSPRVMVEREPDNPHDANALKVVGVSGPPDARVSRTLGYIPREAAAEIAGQRPADLPIAAVASTLWRVGAFVNVRVFLLEPAAKSPFWAARGGAPAALKFRV